jgi:hypothetical protein
MNALIPCYRCQKMGHIAKFCPDRVAPSAKSTTAESVGDTAKQQSGGESANTAASVSHHTFEIEVDDSYEVAEGDIFASDAEVLHMFSQSGDCAEKC